MSTPPLSVHAAYEALRDVLSLCLVVKEDVGGTKSQSRLPKELVQTCIRPVLFNLRDHARLTIPLLRGLARLLSLLSNWFNKTLGEKLLEHLQKWAEPDRIIARKIWRQGDEPKVAASIMDLFVLLPHGSQFVEPLVKIAIKLEAALPRFKCRLVSSPYRRPLAKYLNKHSQNTVGFFFQRLSNPLYSDVFQEITMMEQSEALRQYLGGRNCSVTLLNVCFERPLAIIRSQKTSGSGSTGSTPQLTKTEILSMHGILSDSKQGSRQKEAALRQNIEKKQKRVELLQQELARISAAHQSSSSSSSSKASDNAQRRHHAALAALKKGQAELNESKQRYAAEIAHLKSTKMDSSSSRSTNRRIMTPEAMELQHQGLKLVNTLILYSRAYLEGHNDIVRAVRWLWRSKGRNLRLQYEELIAPKYHEESRILSTLLVKYASAFPTDVDVLYELLQIFLQPTTANYSFVKTFLDQTVTKVLAEDKMKNVIERFFVFLAGEGPDETKVLIIQLLVFPLLHSNFSKQKDTADLRTTAADGDVPMSETNDNTPEDPMDIDPTEQPRGTKAPVPNKADTKLGESNPPPPTTTAVTPKATGPTVITKGQPKSPTEVFGREAVTKFVAIMVRPTTYGDRLRVELLRLSTLLLEFVPESLRDHRNEIIKFSWSLVKSDDTTCKNWAYLNVCRYIAVFDSPPKIIIQVYNDLLRCYQLDGKALVRKSLAILLPAMADRLQSTDLAGVAASTCRILVEDTSNAAQVAHIWHTITSHPEIAKGHQRSFGVHVVASLPRFGLQSNCPLEHRSLALCAVELVVQWHRQGVQISASSAENRTTGAAESLPGPSVPTDRNSTTDAQTKRRIDETDKDAEDESAQRRAIKRSKAVDGSTIVRQEGPTSGAAPRSGTPKQQATATTQPSCFSLTDDTVRTETGVRIMYPDQHY